MPDESPVVFSESMTDVEQRLWMALWEVDTYLASDPGIWRLTAAAKAGDVLCDVLGGDVIQAINKQTTDVVTSRSATVKDRAVALVVGFRRWSRRSPLECRRCGSSVVDAKEHAMWHASLEGGAQRVPGSIGQWSEHRRDTEEFSIAVGDNGWPIP